MKNTVSIRSMARAISLCSTGFLLLFAGANASAAITGSVHDFSGRSWNNTNELCVVCHTPHNADISVSAAPLWNHAITGVTFNTYTSPTFDGAATITQPGGNSKLCLSCHDGTVAVDAFGGAAGGAEFVTGDKAVGRLGELGDDHPISFVYDTALQGLDPGLFDPSAKVVTIGKTGVGFKTKTGTIQDVMLFNDQLECGTCHDVHNNFAGGSPLLRINNAGSGLCLSCHDK
jgi:hypothetical protein